ncbi:uncharacterized protein [Parasteatoda tepidariorum]|uniref:uncharacterized protein isoform X1 n=1 Tax=Parasteatoda tepidariorum TaxID=114398 RepID=UPI001C72626D|nr:protein-methionine sulfoxide oxidase mical3a isoform X1 [Parasteatoda tepidariorum]
MENRVRVVPRGTATSPESAMASELFDQFVSAATFKSVLATYRQLCELLRLKPTNITNFYPRLKAKLHSWRAASLWAKLDKRASHKCYNRGKSCPNARVLIIGAGPCGLRTAIEAQLLGAKVVVAEKRDRYSRNNVLHLWPFVIHDLRNLGAKKFFGKFCAGSIDHISIRQLQIILMKVALLLGVEIHENVGFESLIEPPEDQSHERIGWHANVSPSDHPISQYEFDVLIGADGKRNTLLGFNRKEFRGKLAIAVTANFINRHSPEEARVPEISGVAFIFNQKFFQDMREQTAIDLENIVYYKDDTHYFVMTAKKQSLLERGVIIKDFNDTARLLAAENVDREALMEYARDAADFATSYQLPSLDFAVNHYGQADVAMFDFTSMYAAENACRVVERRGHKLLQGLVGDSLLEPFWPTGSGCARGFLSSFDAAWMIRSWASGKLSNLQVLAERESIYRLLAQTTPENLSKDSNQYTLNPSSRYPNLNLHAVLPSQVRSLYDTDGKIEENILDGVVEVPKKKRRKESMIHPDTLLNWCKKQVALNDKIRIENFTTSWKDGLALCAVLHHYRPDLINLSDLDPENVTKNNQLAFDVCERELGIPPVMTGQEMAECSVPDKLTMVSYISQVYESFRGEIPVVSLPKSNLNEERTSSPSKQIHSTPLTILNKVSNRLQGKRKYSVEKEMAKERDKGENIRKKSSSLFAHKRKSKERASLDKANQDIILTDYKMLSTGKPRESINTRAKNLEEKMKRDAGLRCDMAELESAKGLHLRSEQSELSVKMLQQQLQNNGNAVTTKKSRSPKVGKLQKDEWIMKVVDEKIKQQNTRHKTSHPDKPAVFKEIFTNKLHQMDEKLKAGGTLTPEEEARYKKFDASLNRLKDRLSKGNLNRGERGHNQTAAMTEHMTTIWNKKSGGRKDPLPPAPVSKGNVEPDTPRGTSASAVCYFCKERVYLMQRLSAEGLFFHRTCFKCEFCGAALRLGEYAYDSDALCGGKFYCIPHFRMQKQDVRRQEMMKRKEAFLSCAIEKQEKEKLYQILLDNTEKALSPGRQSVDNKDAPSASPEVVEEKLKPAMSFLEEPENAIGRDQTPERVEYENSILEFSEDDLLTSELEEEELTQKNFGPSQDLATSEDDYSDLSTDSETDEEAFAEELERSLTADETRKLAETWNKKYSTEHSLLCNFSSSSSSADDEESDTEIGSDDTSQDIDSDAEYSTENSEEEDNQETKENEEVELSKTPEEKEFSMEVPVIDLKSINKVSADETSESDLSQNESDTEEGSGDESGTEIDSDSESDSAPLPPQQIPTIVIYESPPQNTDLDQEWNVNNDANKANNVDSKTTADIDDSVVIVSDISTADIKEDSPSCFASSVNSPVEVDTNAEILNVDGKFVELSDKKVDNNFSKSETVSSKPECMDTLPKLAAPLATEESSPDISVASDVNSVAKDIVADILKSAQESILDPSDDFVEKHTSCENLADEIHSKVLTSTPFTKVNKTGLHDSTFPPVENSADKLSNKIEIIDLCTPSPKCAEANRNEVRDCFEDCKDLSVICNSVEAVPEVLEIANSSADVNSEESVLNEFLDDSDDHTKQKSFITIRKHNQSKGNSTYDWDSDKSISFPACYEEEESCLVLNDSESNELHSNLKQSLSDVDENTESKFNQNNTVLISDSPVALDYTIDEELPKQSKNIETCLSQSLPSSSDFFKFNDTLPKSISCSSAKLKETVPKASTILPDAQNCPDSESKSSSFELINRTKDLIENRMVSSCPNPLLDSPKSTSPSPNIKYKGYGGGFAEKIRPKSLFCDSIYLRSLDINLQKQPFSSLNKSDDSLDENDKISNENCVKQKSFDDLKSDEVDKDNDVFLPDQIATSNPPTSNLKSNMSVGSTGKLNSSSKPKSGHHKHPSVSFSSESRGDIVSPYTCSLVESSEPMNFPTKIKPKCDMDISKLRQKREKRKSVHEDLQGLPFADEEKMMSPVEPVTSMEGFSTPKMDSKSDDFSSDSTTASAYKTPDLVDEDRYLRMQSTAEQERARQEARARARLKSDEELGLSPNNYRKKYRRQLSLNSINYDELCSDEFCDQDDDLEDEMINNFCQTNNNTLEETFSMFKNSNLFMKGKSTDAPIVSSQPNNQCKTTNRSLSTGDEYSVSTDSLDSKNSQEQIQPAKVGHTKHSSIASLSETSPDSNICESPIIPKMQAKTKSKRSLTEGLNEDDKTKSNGKKSIFSILNFSKSNVSKEKVKQKAKSSEKDLSTSLPNDIGTANKSKPFSHLKLAKAKEKGNKPKAKSVPPESVTPVETSPPQEDIFNVPHSTQQAIIIPKYTVYRNLETNISSFPVHLPIPKLENGLAPKASEDSFSEEEDTQGSKVGHIPNSDKNDSRLNEKEKKAQRIVQKVQRQQVLKRLRNAQEIQRRLEELEIKQKELEQRGVELEKILRGEENVFAKCKCCLNFAGVRDGKEEAELEWYTLVHTKNRLTREVQELLIRLKDLELEDRHCRLQQEITERMAQGSHKNATQLIEERKILDEMLKIVDKRNELVTVLEQLRLREEEDEKNINSEVFMKGTKSPLSPSKS